MAEIGFGAGLEIGEDVGGDLLGGEGVGADLDDGLAGAVLEREWEVLDVGLQGGIIELATKDSSVARFSS